MELYKEVSGYKGLYAVSNYGNVKSLNYNHTGKEKILKPHDNNHGYMLVDLCKNGKVKHHLVHRLVASAFIENPDNLPQVNHKDEVKTYNTVENLEWCSQEYNHNYGSHNQRVAETKSISIDMLTKQGEFIRQFPSSREAERWLRVNGFPKAAQSSITMCCKGNRNTHCGFKWRYAQGD